MVNPPPKRPKGPQFGPDPARDSSGRLLEHPPPPPVRTTPVVGVNSTPLYAKREEIILRNSRMCDDGAWALTASVQINDIIRCIDLSYNEITGLHHVMSHHSRYKYHLFVV